MSSAIPDALGGWLRLAAIPGIGGETQRRLLQTFGLPDAIFAASHTALREVIGESKARTLLESDTTAAVAAGLSWATGPGHHILTLADAGYPQALLTIPDPPPLLFAQGRTELLSRPALAVVGSRNGSRQGEQNAEAFAAALSRAGLTIVSGLALGIDAAAHRGGLAGPASTIAVIGTGPDRIYPARNADLARQIAEQGLILSEFPLGTPALAANFPRRNRIIAGLGLGCLVVEAAERSGSLITARLAAESGREIFAIPGSIHSPLARGCHRLIRDGAKLVESAADILEELRWNAPAQADSAPNSTDAPETGPEAALLAALGHDPCSLETLAERTGLTADALLAILLAQELDGRVAQLPGGFYQRLAGNNHK
ncbi:MAG: DNA-protecting protein DprA [Proteobacteria bacterium]|nr:DNA-protecting protein DprA [Pseudomonadota bacterium]HQR03593.1 DNA-processing protein DprA [Rhodocyclaceae bacterium]